MKRIKTDDMKVSISYSNKKVNKDRLCDIVVDILKQLNKKEGENN